VLGFVGALWARRTLVPVPRLASPFIVALRERGSTAIHGRRPPIRVRLGSGNRSGDPSGDHFPNIINSDSLDFVRIVAGTRPGSVLDPSDQKA
jgi:hypothetical protein